MSKKNKNKQQNKEDPSFYHNGFPLDSKGEYDFLMWCEELKEAGFIDKIERGKSYLLCNGLTNSYLVQLKTKCKSMTQTIMMPHSYTSDFTITFTEQGRKIFCSKFGEKWEKLFMSNDGIVHIENKPNFDQNNMERLARVNVKFVWDKYQEFVHIVKNDDIFRKTFLPQILVKTKQGKDRVWHFKIRTLNEFLKLTQ